MAEKKQTETGPAKPALAFTQSVDEFCTDLSVNDRRVELIGAFNSEEKRAGRHKDTAAAYSQRYQDFIKRAA